MREHTANRVLKAKADWIDLLDEIAEQLPSVGARAVPKGTYDQAMEQVYGEAYHPIRQMSHSVTCERHSKMEEMNATDL